MNRIIKFFYSVVACFSVYNSLDYDNLIQMVNIQSSEVDSFYIVFDALNVFGIL